MIISILHKNSTILLLFSALIISGCGRKPTVVSTSYQQEMVNFINNTQEGQELFSFYLYPERSESFFQNGFYYFYELESGRRYYQVDIGGQASMYGFEDIYDAVVRINDTLYGTLHRIVGADTSIYRHLEIAVTRYAYFLKLFTDDNSFHGWRFWGYGVDNLDPRQYGTLLPGSGGSFSAFQSGDVIDVKSTIRSKMGFYFIFKNNIVKLPRGDTLTYRSVNRDILFAETNDGVRIVMDPYESGA